MRPRPPSACSASDPRAPRHATPWGICRPFDVGITLKSTNGVSTPRLERLLNGELAAWVAQRTPIPALERTIAKAGASASYFQLALKNGEATTHILGWVRLKKGTLTLCVDGASVDKPTPLRQQLRELWTRGVERKVSDPAFGRFIGVAIDAIRKRLAADPTIQKVEIRGTQIASPHLASMLTELGFTIDLVQPTVPNVMAYGIAAGGIALTAAQIAELSLSGLVVALSVVLAGGLTIYKASGMKGSYTVDRYENA